MVTKNIDKLARENLIEIISRLAGADEILEFLRSLMSSSEIKDLSRRLLAARMLKEGATYSSIQSQMGMSPTTVNKVYLKTKNSKVLNEYFDEFFDQTPLIHRYRTEYYSSGKTKKPNKHEVKNKKR